MRPPTATLSILAAIGASACSAGGGDVTSPTSPPLANHDPATPAPPTAAAPLVVAELPTPTPADPLVYVPELPVDLALAPPPTEHGVHDEEPPPTELTESQQVEAFVVAVFTARFDDLPDLRLQRLIPLTVDPTVAAAAVAAHSVDIAGGEVTWPIVTAVAATGDGWWRVELTLKTTRRGQVGVTSTLAAMRVHHTPAGVDDWTSP